MEAQRAWVPCDLWRVSCSWSLLNRRLMSSTLQKTKKRKPKRKPTREDDIPQDLKFGPFARFLFSKELCRDFISSVALYKPEENQDEKKKEKKEEKKEKKTVNKQVSKYLKQKNPFFFFSATPVHRAWGDDIVELLQDRLPWGQDQQDSIEWACCAAFSKVIEGKKNNQSWLPWWRDQ